MNSENDNPVRLSGREFLYLKNAAFLPEELRRIIDAAAANRETAIVMTLSRDMSERFREVFTERLAKVGFDRAYEPTNEGRLLETLIDRFYVK